MGHDQHEHDRGLEYDLGKLMERRSALRLFAGAGLAVVAAGCAGESATTSTPSAPSSTTSSSPSAPSSGTTSADPATCEEIPSETAGPFPGDGSNGPNILAESGIVRSDITKSFGSASGVATGVPLTVELTIQDSGSSCAPMSGAAVYIWHCDAEGRYSMYSEGAENENYLRGVQATDETGKVTFTSIFPAAYTGRWPHIHFEVYSSLSEATSAGKISATSQLAFPEEACNAVYASDGYDGSSSNMQRTSLEDDNVFGDDDGVHQLATVTGSVAEGYVARLTVGV